MVTFEQAKEAWIAYSTRAERIESAAQRVVELKRIRTIGGWEARGTDIWGAIDDLAKALESK